MENAESVAAILQYHGVLSFSVYRSISVRLVHIGREGVLSVAVHRAIVIAKDRGDKPRSFPRIKCHRKTARLQMNIQKLRMMQD